MQISAACFVFCFHFIAVANGNGLLENKEKRFMAYKRFLLDKNSTNVSVSLQQFAACFLTCVPGYEKLTEACCNFGIDVVCLNLPWDVLKASLGLCSGNPAIPTPATQTAWVSLEQFAACFLTCVHGFEKLTEICCKIGINDVCLNLPWDLLKPYLRSCQGLLYSKTISTASISQTKAVVTKIMTSPTHSSSKSTLALIKQSTALSTIMSTTPTTTTTSTTQLTTQPPPYWLPWGEWKCEEQNNQCFQRRFRNCSTNNDKDCMNEQGGVRYSISLCTKVSCPEYFTTTTPKTPAYTTPLDTCQDDPVAVGCKDNITLVEVCKENAKAWNICPASCNLCDTCWDYLNCSSPGAQNVFCGRDEYALKYCRQTCGRCGAKPVPVRLNACGDPVANEPICETLQAEICICNDPDVRALCGRYCNNKCDGHPLTGTDCIPARRRKRDAALQRHVFH